MTMAMSMTAPAMPRPAVPAHMPAHMALTQIPGWGIRDLGFWILARRRPILAAGVLVISRDTMAARHRAERGQTLIIGVRRLNFSQSSMPRGAALEHNGAAIKAAAKTLAKINRKASSS